MSKTTITVKQEDILEDTLAISIKVQQVAALLSIAEVLLAIPNVSDVSYIQEVKDRLNGDLLHLSGKEGIDPESIEDLVQMNLAVLKGSLAGIQHSGVIPDKDIPDALSDAEKGWRSVLDKGVAKYDASS